MRPMTLLPPTSFHSWVAELLSDWVIISWRADSSAGVNARRCALTMAIKAMAMGTLITEAVRIWVSA